MAANDGPIVLYAAYVRLGYTPDTSLPDGTKIQGHGQVVTSIKDSR